jgi:hypothetical protein
MNAGLDENEAEFRVLVLPVGLEVLSHGDRLFDEVPKVLGDGRCQSYPQTKRQKVRHSRKEKRARRKGEQIAAEEGVRRRTVGFEDTENLVSGDEAHLGDAV